MQVDQIMHIMYAAVHSGIPYVEDYYYQVGAMGVEVQCQEENPLEDCFRVIRKASAILPSCLLPFLTLRPPMPLIPGLCQPPWQGAQRGCFSARGEGTVSATEVDRMHTAHPMGGQAGSVVRQQSGRRGKPFHPLSFGSIGDFKPVRCHTYCS